MLSESSLKRYRSIRDEVADWLGQNGIAYLAPSPLPSGQYADASHPLAPGYEQLARLLYEDDGFERWLSGLSVDPP